MSPPLAGTRPADDCEGNRPYAEPGTSAPTLALTWSGPLDLLGALGTVPELADLSVERVTAGAKATC